MASAEALETLRSLDRRLLGVEGELEDPPEGGFAYNFFGIGGSVRTTDAGECARHHVELRQIRAELEAVAHAHELPLAGDTETATQRFDPDATYGALRERARKLRDATRELFDRLRRDAPQADPLPAYGPVAPERARPLLHRLGPRIAGSVIVLPLIGALLYFAASADDDEDRETAAALCQRPPPCAGDVPWVAVARDPDGVTALRITRASADCEQRVEVFYDGSRFDFRGSVDAPTEEFSRRRAVWLATYEVVDEVSCAQVDDLL